MSVPLRFRWRSAALALESGLSPTARLLACVLADEYATNASPVLDPAPGSATLARRMGCSPRTVDAARAALEAGGWLAITPRTGRPSRVRLVLPAEPPQNLRGSEAATPAATPATTPATTPADFAVEQGEPGEPGEPGGAERAVARPAPTLAGEITDELVAHYRACLAAAGSPAPSRSCAQLAREARTLIAKDGIRPALVARAIELLVDRRQPPSTLAGFVVEAAAGPPLPRQEMTAAQALHERLLRFEHEEGQ